MIARLMGLRTISPGDLIQQIQNHAVTTIDVNQRRSWVTSRVPGARHVDPVGYTEQDLPADRNAALVFYCSNFLCRKAPNAARRAKQMGFTNVRVMSAGIQGWLEAGLPVESGEPAHVS